SPATVESGQGLDALVAKTLVGLGPSRVTASARRRGVRLARLFCCSAGTTHVVCIPGWSHMKAIRLHARGGPKAFVYEEAPQPHPGATKGVCVHRRNAIHHPPCVCATYRLSQGPPRAHSEGTDLSQRRAPVCVLWEALREPRVMVPKCGALS